MFHLFGLFPLHGAASRPPWWSMWSFGTIVNREKKPWHIHQSCCHRILLQELQPNLTNSLSSVTSDEDAFLVQTGNGCAHIRCARCLQGCCSESGTGVFKSWTQTADKELKEKHKNPCEKRLCPTNHHLQRKSCTGCKAFQETAWNTRWHFLCASYQPDI